MADEKPDAQESAQPGGSGKKLIILIVLALTLLAGGGGAAWFLMGSDSEKTTKDSGHESAKNDSHPDEPGPILVMDPFVLNLADREEIRYLKMTIKVELDRPEKESDFQARLPAIRDSLLLLLTSKESRNLRTVNGKRRVRSEIMSRANGILKKGKITKVFFTDFIIQ